MIFSLLKVPLSNTNLNFIILLENCVKFNINIFYTFQMIHPNFYVNLIQDEHVIRK